MLAVQRKRAREPTPPPTPLEALDLPSPLDFLRSKRRKSDQPLPQFGVTTPDVAQTPGGYFTPSRPLAPPTPLEVDAGVERRRSKAWERRNADPLPPKWGANVPASVLETPAQPASQPPPLPMTSSSPSHGMVRAYSEPEASTSRHHLMSSSPIRHQPFDSSPFRDRDSASTRVDPDAEGWDMAEVERAWGEEYTHQNSLLYSLHRARRDAASQTPDQTFLQTPSVPAPSPVPFMTNATPDPLYPYRDYRDTPPSSTHYSSSPFSNAHTRASSSNIPLVTTPHDDDDGMEILQDSHYDPHHAEVQRRYEEANRLLGQLEVARRQRWGEGPARSL